MDKETFVVDCLSKAEWALRKIKEHRERIEEKETQAAIMHDDINAWLNKEIEEDEKSISHFEALLKPYIQSLLAGESKKSINLPSGKAGFRQSSTEWTIGGEPVTKDNPALLAWLKQSTYDSSHFIKQTTTETVLWSEYKKTLTPTPDGRVVNDNGEIVPGMSAVKQPDKFYVEAL